jgi:CheY-like chemotaxis protein
MVEHPHILVVDDESQITRVLRTSLSAQGYDIRIANTGEMALEIMKDWTPNLIITDLSMPSSFAAGFALYRKCPSLCFQCATRSSRRWRRSTPEPTIM